jgi:hypothetical protein
MLGNTEEALKNWNKAVGMGSESKSLKKKIEEKKYIREE